MLGLNFEFSLLDHNMQTNKVHPQILYSSRISSTLVPALEKVLKSCPWFSYGKLSQETKSVISWLSDCQYGSVDSSNTSDSANELSSKGNDEIASNSAQESSSVSLSYSALKEHTDRTISHIPRFSSDSNASFSSENCNDKVELVRTKSVEKEKHFKVFSKLPFKLSSSDHCTLVLFEDETKGIGEDAAKFVLKPLLTGCKTNVFQLVEPAMICFQELITNGVVRGNMQQIMPHDSSENALNLILNCVCDSVSSCEEGSRIEIASLKVLLSFVVSSHIHLHEDALLQILNSIFILHSRTNSSYHKAVSKAVLLQLLSVLFSLIESNKDGEYVKSAHLINVSDYFTSKEVSFTQLCEIQSFLEGLMCDESQKTASNSQLIKISFIKSLASCMRWKNESIDSRYMSRFVLEAIPPSVLSSISALGSTMKLNRTEGWTQPTQNAFVAFQHLCRIASVNLQKGNALDSKLMNEKILALELLCFLLERVNSSLFIPGRFFDCLRLNLCPSLLETHGYGVPVLVQLSLSLFLRFITCSNMSLKPEISEFFPMLIFRMLDDNANTSFLNKIIVLRFIENLCQFPQLLIDLFVNFDCDIHLCNVFESLITSLSNCARGSPSGSITILSADEASALRLGAVKVLVSILSAIHSWLRSKLDQPPPSDSTDDVATLSSQMSSSPPLPESTSEGKEEEEEEVEDEMSLEMNGEVIPIPSSSSSLPYPSSSYSSSSSYPSSTIVSSSSDTSSSSSLDPFSSFSLHPFGADEFSSQKAKKMELQKGICLFNSRPSDGVNFLMKSPLLQKSTDEIARLFRLDKGMDRVMVGEYMGQRDDTAISIMRAFVNTFNFENMSLDDAVRMFVGSFRLCGEAQKIDRILEAFAVRYCECCSSNSNSSSSSSVTSATTVTSSAFASAGTVHTLAFSIIMLNTDAHNPAVKIKMKKSEFIKNNRGIDEGKDLSAEMLSGLYERVVKNEIKMAGEEPLAQAWNKPKRRFSKLTSLSKSKNSKKKSLKEEMMKSHLANSDALSKVQLHLDSIHPLNKESPVYHRVSDAKIVREMLLLISSPLLLTLTLPLNFRGSELGDHCIEGLRLAIEISSLMELPAQRDDFHFGLTRFLLMHSSATKAGETPKTSKALNIITSNQPIDFAVVKTMGRSASFPLPSLLSCCYSKRRK